MGVAVQSFDSVERLDRAVVARRSAEALEDLMRHAFENVPYYRDALSRIGFSSPGDLHADDLDRFPVLTRQAVREGLESGELLARGVPWRRRVVTNSSGTTGAPLRFYGDMRSRRMRRRGWQLLDRWAGIRPGDRLVRMMVPRPRPTWSPGQPLRSLRKMIRFRQPADLVSILKLTADDVPGIVQALDANVGPYHIYGSYETGGGVAQTCPDNPQVHHVLSELVFALVRLLRQPEPPDESVRDVPTRQTT